jgi:hypothetical protein
MITGCRRLARHTSRDHLAEPPLSPEEEFVPVPPLAGPVVDAGEAVQIELTLEALVLGLFEEDGHDGFHKPGRLVDPKRSALVLPRDDAPEPFLLFRRSIQHVVELPRKLEQQPVSTHRWGGSSIRGRCGKWTCSNG